MGTHTRKCIHKQHPLMDLQSVLHFLENKTILVTGATGYLAKIFVEKVLRIQPNLKRIYLLLRAADAQSATERFLNEVMGTELFMVLREKHGANLNSFVSEKLSPVPGDISLEELGVGDPFLKEKMWKEVNVVVNFAATTSFDERYEVALGINTLGALHVFNFANKCFNIQMLLHVSTAYVCREDAGLILEESLENVTARIDIDLEKRIAQEKLNELRSNNATEKQITSSMKDLGIERARLHGWPNTYAFTKAMAEMLLMRLKDDMPLLILRPTMVTSTYKEPFPGWIEGARTIDGIIVSYAKGKVTCFISHPQATLDVIPADMVINALIVAMVSRANQLSSDLIYHVGSSLRNPVKFSQVHDFSFRFFTKNPWINKDGRAVKISRGTVLSSMSMFHMYMTVRFLLPLKALHLLNSLLLHKYEDTCIVMHSKIKLVMRLVDLYKPYVLFEGLFDDTNTEKLRSTFRSSSFEADSFNFDPMSIIWEDYMMKIHIPGLVKYVMK